MGLLRGAERELGRRIGARRRVGRERRLRRLGTTGGNIRLIIIYDTAELELPGHDELHHINQGDHRAVAVSAAHIRLMQRRVAGLRQDLIDSAPGQDVAAQEDRDQDLIRPSLPRVV